MSKQFFCTISDQNKKFICMFKTAIANQGHDLLRYSTVDYSELLCNWLNSSDLVNCMSDMSFDHHDQEEFSEMMASHFFHFIGPMTGTYAPIFWYEI